MKFRADELLAKLGLAPSRAAAQQFIKAGNALLPDGSIVRKPSQLLDETCGVTIAAEVPRYVSRGALKLLAAIEAFQPAVAGKVALDLGASTGGFTEVLLERDARKVYAVDVGTGQLHEKLKCDPRVVSLEQTNAKDLDNSLVADEIQILTGDLSFISLTKVLPACLPLLASEFTAILLIKPQFEAERGEIGSGGVVRNPEVRARCVTKIEEFATQKLGWQHLGTIQSPIEGQKGNIEYLAAFKNA